MEGVFQAAREHGAAAPGIKVADTLERVGPDQTIVETISRDGLVAIQTPQAFRRDLLVRAYANRQRVSGVTDDARLVEAIGQACRVVDGSSFNLKITTAEDLRLAGAILQARPRPKREGPAHPFADEQAMWDDKPPGKFQDLF